MFPFQELRRARWKRTSGRSSPSVVEPVVASTQSSRSTSGEAIDHGHLQPWRGLSGRSAPSMSAFGVPIHPATTEWTPSHPINTCRGSTPEAITIESLANQSPLLIAVAATLASSVDPSSRRRSFQLPISSLEASFDENLIVPSSTASIES